MPPLAPYKPTFQQHAAPGRIGYVRALAGYRSTWPREARICDVCCGAGLTALTTAAANPGWQVVGVDGDARQIARAAHQASQRRVANVSFRQADVRDIRPDVLGRFDLVILSGTLSWLPSAYRRQALSNAAALVDDGGCLYVHYMNRNSWAALLPVYAAARGFAGQEGHRVPVRSLARSLRGLGAEVLQTSSLLHARLSGYDTLSDEEAAHDVENPDWQPDDPAEVRALLGATGFRFAGDVLYGEKSLLRYDAAALEQLPEAWRPSAAADPSALADLVFFRLDRHDLHVRHPAGGEWEPLASLDDMEVVALGDLVPWRDGRVIGGARYASSEPFVQELRAAAHLRERTVGELLRSVQGCADRARLAVAHLVALGGLHVLPQRGDGQSGAAAAPSTADWNRRELASGPAAGNTGVLLSPLLGAGLRANLPRVREALESGPDAADVRRLLGMT